MIIFFGWRNAPKDFGPTVPSTCTKCRHRTMLHYVRSMTWFHLFFVPAFRFDREDALVCPVCGSDIWLSADQGRIARDVANAYGSWSAHRSSDEQYNAEASRLLRTVEPVEREIERRRSGRPDEPDDVASALPSRDFAESAAWRADPSGRHELRFWDGSEWTAYVSDTGATGSDTVLTPSAAGWYPDPGLGNETRYWDGRFWTDRVQNRGIPANDPLTPSPT